MSTSGGNFLEHHVESQKKVGPYMQSLTGRASVRCLELLETVFDSVERLSRKAAGLRPSAAQTLADRGDSERAMKAGAN
jgi:hypothetical protein